jgi:hypothetical protein
MAKFQITGPDGGTYEVTAPDDADENQILQYVRANAGAPGGEQRTASLSPPDRMGMLSESAPRDMKMPEPTWGETGKDVLKSGGIGLAQGGLSLASLPGNVEMLGRMGIDKGAELLGFQNPNTVSGQKLPHYGDYKKAVESYTGKFYEPQTTAGKYARTVGEFAPMMLDPTRGIGSKLATTAAAGVASEAAGQATEGTAAEPYARFAGGVVGGMLPRGAIRTATPNPVAPERQQQLNVLAQEGVTDLTAGQRTGARPLRWAESVTQDTPFAGTRAADMQTRQAEQFTRAALRRSGINADRATPDVLDAGFARLGQQFETLAQNVSIPPSRRLTRDLARAAQEYNDVVAPTMRVPMVNGIIGDLTTVFGQGQPIGGRAYSTLSSSLARRAREVQFSDPQLSRTLYDIRHALDNAAERAMPRQLAGQYAQVRREYRNLLTIEKAASGAGENAVQGLISPAQLRTAAKTTNKRDYSRGRDDLSELARAGVAIMSPLPQSGTAPRAYAQGVMQVVSGAGGYGVAGPLGAGAAVMAPGLMGRALMSRPVQNYLGNQTLAPAYNALQNPAPRSHQTVIGPMMFEDQ